jgi:uncharacterized membrane protein YozB (DUF420 family)
MIIGTLLYCILLALGALLALALILAPLTLYAIHRELKWQSEEMRTQTRLLASLANSAPETATSERKLPQAQF